MPLTSATVTGEYGFFDSGGADGESCEVCRRGTGFDAADFLDDVLDDEVDD